MEQRDIDKLLACRKAIDDHRARKETARSVEASATTANKASAYTTMQDSFTTSKDTYMSVLLENGFETVDDFYKFNNTMCLSALKGTLELLTGCDKCKGLYDSADKTPCTITDGCPDFYDQWEDTQEWQDRLYEIILYIWHNSEVKEDGTFTKLLKELPVKDSGDFNKGGFSICPDGHGFTFKFNGMPAFDLNWNKQ